MDFRAQPGEIFFSDEEKRIGSAFGDGFIVIEPNVPMHKSVAPNKDWGANRYRAVAAELSSAGYKIIQFWYPHAHVRCEFAEQVNAESFRNALAILSHAALYIGPEGGLHHGAAAVGVPAVVLFGGFIPPQVTGYTTHTNLTGGAYACGSLQPCIHCRKAMQAIGVSDVLTAAFEHLRANECSLSVAGSGATSGRPSMQTGLGLHLGET
jgi:ADP-heptose:LPS heptosyltransferase